MPKELAFVLLLVAPALAQPREKLLLSNAHVLAPDGDRFLAAQDILIEGERIAKIGATGGLPAEGAKKIDCSGLYILPGLIDLHTHLLLRPYDEVKWDDQVLRESLELRTIRATVFARKTLEAGFTTIRDLGTEGAGFADVALRDAVRDGLIPGPRIFAVTRAIVASGCYGPDGFDPRWDVPKGAQEVSGVGEVRRAVRQQVAGGADWIKVYADYRRNVSGAATPTFSQEELNVLVEEAKSAGLQVAAHATVDEGIRRAVVAGVATIEHGYEGSLEVFKLMKERGVVLCPTLAASEAMARYGGWTPDAKDDPRIVKLREMFQRALQSGVTIACGSDAGPFAHGDNARELELMVEFGMTPQQAIATAMGTAAKVLRRQQELGRIEKSYAADLVAIQGNPFESISALRDPRLVLKSGNVLLDRRQTMPKR